MKLFLSITFVFLSLSNFSLSYALIKSDYIDISGANYGRLNISIINDASDTLPLKLLKTNLIWSGLFNIVDPSKNPDLDLIIQQKGENINFIIRDISEKNTYFDFSSSPKILENKGKIILLVNSIVKSISGSPGVLGTAILYSKQIRINNKTINIINTHAEEDKVIIDQGYQSILPKWNQKGDAFIYTSVEDYSTKLYYYRFDGELSKILAYYKGVSSGGNWVPNTNEIVLTISTRGNPDIYKIDTNGKLLMKLTRRSTFELSPSISPDGQSLLFVSNRSGSVQIYKKDLFSGKTKRMTFDGSYNTEPQWSPDGSFFVFSSIQKGKFQIFLMDKNGNSSTQLTSGKGKAEHPDWSPDGRQIIYTSSVNGDLKLFIMTIDGQYKRRITATGAGIQETHPSWNGNYRWQ